MNRLTTVMGLSAVFLVSRGTLSSQQSNAPAQEIIASERAALTRWVKLDPQGYLDLYAPDVTYFDPQRDKRIDGLDAMKVLLEPIKQLKAPFTDARFEMIDPKVQQQGGVALLTFNLISYGKVSGGPETVLARWNSTEVYARLGERWKIIHSHWSYTKPDLKPRTP